MSQCDGGMNGMLAKIDEIGAGLMKDTSKLDPYIAHGHGHHIAAVCAG